MSSGGRKTTKNVIDVSPSIRESQTGELCLEEAKLLGNVDVDDVEEDFKLEASAEIVTNADKRGKELPSLSSLLTSSEEVDAKEGDVSFGLSTEQNVKIQVENEELDSSKAVLVTKTPKTLVLGAKVVPSSRSPAMKSNITFISSKALSKVFPPEKLQTPTTVQAKSLLKNSSSCAFLKMSPKMSSIRLVRSVGAPLTASSSLKGALSNASPVGNIVTKTFTISSNPSRESMTGKRRVSLDSATINVSKRNRGTSTDQILEELSLKDSKMETTSVVPLEVTQSLISSVIDQILDETHSLEESSKYDASLDTPMDAKRETELEDIMSGQNLGNIDSFDVGEEFATDSLTNMNHSKILQEDSTIPNSSSAETFTPVTKILSPSKTPTLTMPSNELLTTLINVTKDLVTSPVTPNSSSSLVPHDKEHLKMDSTTTDTTTHSSTQKTSSEDSSPRTEVLATPPQQSMEFEAPPQLSEKESIQTKNDNGSASIEVQSQDSNSRRSKSPSPTKSPTTAPKSKKEVDLALESDSERTEHTRSAKLAQAEDVIKLSDLPQNTLKSESLKRNESSIDTRPSSALQNASASQPQSLATFPKKTKAKNGESPSRITRSTAKTAASKVKRRLRSSL